LRKNLQAQVKNDLRFIGETEKALAEKKKEWGIRSDLRAGEIAAINKAVSILYSDDARDTFKSSFESQVSLIETTKKVQASVSQAAAAAAALRSAASRSGKTYLNSLASMVVDAPPAKLSATHFKEVIAAIDKMVIQLKKDEQKDYDIKQKCEVDRMDDTREAIDTSRNIDSDTELIAKLTSDIAKLDAKIAELKQEHKDTDEALDEATKMRKKENLAWVQTDKDDAEALKLVKKANGVLESFYKDNNLALVQKGKQPVEGMAAGDAPPPPPTTWEAPYGGKTGEATGIIAIMEMVAEDIQKDKTTAHEEEKAAEAEFQDFKKESIEKMNLLKKQKNQAEREKGQAQGMRSQTKKERGGDKRYLVDTIKTIKGIDPNCEYFEVNYVMRRENRFVELDGLQKAKAILKGGKFDAPDPDREIVPGDAAAALLQRGRRVA